MQTALKCQTRDETWLLFWIISKYSRQIIKFIVTSLSNSCTISTFNNNDLLFRRKLIMPVVTKAFTLSCVLLTLTGCASMTGKDPFESFNRTMYALNNDLDRALLKPLAETYHAITPEPVDKGVTNFFNNLDDVLVVVNDLLQFKFKQAASDTSRLFINSTVGILGVIDVAKDFDLPKRYEDFGQTLGSWGFDSGPYLVLPFLGPSSFRDALGRPVDYFADPRIYFRDDHEDMYRASSGLRLVDMRADLMKLEQVLDTSSIDNYSAIRDAYLQRREYLVHDGNPPIRTREAVDEDFLFDDKPSSKTPSRIKPKPKQ